MTSKVIVYYSATGNTSAMLKCFNEDEFDIINIRKDKTVDFDKYDIIIFGTSTWGRGIPPRPFFNIRDDLVRIKNKKIGLFGSGRTEFEFFCGALDLLEELLKKDNEIIFKFKYEGYPKDIDFDKFSKLVKETFYETN
ncbi:flavodoxin family protein [Siminovitchia sp. 179-K 8D1 HS]|uniref:flavodoxin family protein n=1 Tax=Siminovitchia sp. 179-K 8D1 HS TaxID=3142385 RepID=UPI0039A244CA